MRRLLLALATAGCLTLGIATGALADPGKTPPGHSPGTGQGAPQEGGIPGCAPSGNQPPKCDQGSGRTPDDGDDDGGGGTTSSGGTTSPDGTVTDQGAGATGTQPDAATASSETQPQGELARTGTDLFPLALLSAAALFTGVAIRKVLAQRV